MRIGHSNGLSLNTKFGKQKLAARLLVPKNRCWRFLSKRILTLHSSSKTAQASPQKFTRIYRWPCSLQTQLSFRMSRREISGWNNGWQHVHMLNAPCTPTVFCIHWISRLVYSHIRNVPSERNVTCHSILNIEILSFLLVHTYKLDSDLEHTKLSNERTRSGLILVDASTGRE